MTSSLSVRRAGAWSLPIRLYERLLDGISMYSTLAQARRKAKTSPRLGTFVAEVQIPIGAAGVRVERTLGPGHRTVWAQAGSLAAWVISIVPVVPAPVE